LYQTYHRNQNNSDKIIVPTLEPYDLQKHKFCPQCRRYHPYKKFNKNRTRFDGFSSECKRCVNSNQAGYRAKRLAAKDTSLAITDQ
jgi:hypothetical protein